MDLIQLFLNKGLFIIIIFEDYKDGRNWLWQILDIEPLEYDRSTGMYGDNGEYKTYEEAFNTAVLSALYILNNYYN